MAVPSGRGLAPAPQFPERGTQTYERKIADNLPGRGRSFGFVDPILAGEPANPISFVDEVEFNGPASIPTYETKQARPPARRGRQAR